MTTKKKKTLCFLIFKREYYNSNYPRVVLVIEWVLKPNIYKALKIYMAYNKPLCKCLFKKNARHLSLDVFWTKY
jgi:hypothetical protein